MNFLSAVEPRTAQAASSGTNLLPQFRTPAWQTGMHSSAATELFVTGSLPTTGTLPPSALSTYQHPTTFSNRNFATTSPLVLQDSTFNTTANGILNPHDPLLQIKTSQGTVPTALAFERLGSSALSNSIPPQSSTYRSAQESAPHLLQPQFSLLPSALGGAQQTPQAYSSTLFPSSTASIERALLRECSVIKHHQRPSGTQSNQAQLTGSQQHSLQNYLANASIVNFQETTRQSSLSCSSIGDSTQNLPATGPTQNYISLHSSQNTQTQESSSPQSQKYLPVVQSTSFASSTHCQTLQNSLPSPDPESFSERKLDSSVYTSSKQEEEFPMQQLQVLQPQTSLESSTQRISDGEINSQDSIYKVSKADDRYSQSVIRSNSRLEDQVGISLQGSKKDESVVGSVSQLGQQIGQVSNTPPLDIKKAPNLMQTPQIRLNAKDLNEQHSLMHKVHEAKTQEQQDQIINSSSQIQIPTHTGPGHQVSVPNTQVLLDSACDLQILQQSLLQAGLTQVKSSLQGQRVQSPQQIVHPFLQMDGHIIQSNGDPPQTQLHPPNSEIMKMDLSESSKPSQQHLTTKDHFNETNQHDSKSQFVSLGSICFPEAMLLSDERNMLSNVDDILAATAAACGVTPEFPKSTSNETIQSVEGGDSKSHFQQALDVRHVTSDFNSITATARKPQNISEISLNGGQITINLSPVPTLQSKITLDQKHIEAPDQNITSKVISSVVGPSHEDHDQSSGSIKNQSATNRKSEENSEVPIDNILNTDRNQELASNRRSINGESATTEGEFTLGPDDGGVSVNPARRALALMAIAQPGDAVNVKIEDENQDLLHLNLQKKKNKGRGQGKEDDNNNQKQVKRPTQGKRHNPRGTDMYAPYTPPSSESSHDGYQHQEKMRQKIKEVEEKQPEVKTGFIASFLDFLKSGPKQQFSTLTVRVPNRTRRQGSQIVRTFCPPPLPKTLSATPVSLVSETGGASPSGKVDNELKSLEHLSSFSSDEDDPGVCSHDIYKSISSTLTALDATSDKKKKTEALQVATTSPTASITGTVTTSSTTVGAAKQEPPYSTPSIVNNPENINATEPPKHVEHDDLPSEQFAKGQDTVAIEGCTDEENTESGGEGQYRERDEFVVKIEDIEAFKEALKLGKEPPAIWKVQKALLQKFVPEIRDGQREFAATNSYLGYFGDAKNKYKRIYVKFIENTNKKEYVRVCSKKPRNKPSQTIRTVQAKSSSGSKTSDSPTPKAATTKAPSVKPKVKQLKVKAEPPPKKRKKWKEEFSSSQSDSSPEIHSSTDEEFDPPAPFVTRFLNTRAMKETFKSYMELLVSIALDPDTMQALEKSNDELLLPHMKKIDGMLNDNRKRLLLNLHLDQPFKNALESFPELTIITRDSKAKTGGTVLSKIKMNGKAYNKKTLRTSKATTKSAQEFAVDPEKIQLYSLYHSLHHYKYHVYLICKDEISSVQKKNEDLGQEEIVQLCMKNVKWVEDLFEKFGELLNHVQQKCS
ncbi:PREDICTED: glutamine and serine-rich protein 1 [Elephantulus edwardii]|uniref:glutamine and serine-rich protein 1 n=1 Tax=Elephantulus edwardii TaxID=28737 RepID=UPI0003F09FBE|nr:PREDICTED: glutamine and serine-rich protein 1 [Elephantulus edwardii]